LESLDLSNLRDLTHLNLGVMTNGLNEDTLINSFENLVKLKELTLPISVTKKSLASVAILSNLETLVLHNNFKNEDLTPVCSLPSLKTLKWVCRNNTSEILSDVANLTNLTFLGIDSKIRSDAGLAHLTSLVNLKQFQFQNNSDVGLFSFQGNVTRLHSLNIFRCPKMTIENLFNYIASLSLLNCLSIHHVVNIPASAWDSITHLSGLKILKVGNAGVINTPVISSFLKFTNLRHLEFSDPVGIDETEWDNVRKLTNLRALSISERDSRRASAFSSSHLSPLEQLPNLTHLTLTGCNRVKNLDALKDSKKLNFLNLSKTKIDDKSLYILDCLPLLTHVLIEENDVSDECIPYFSKLKDLRQLNVNGCRNITYTEDTIKDLISNKNFLFLHD